MKLYIAFFATIIASPAIAGSGSLNGNKTLNFNGNSNRAITCNSHRFGSDGSQRFSCEYTDQTVLNSSNDSLFIGEISTTNTNGRDRGFHMVQLDDQSQYYAVYSGQVSNNGQVSGTFVDNSGNSGLTFTIN